MEGLFTTERPRQHVRIDRYEEIRRVTAVDVRGEEHHGRARRERGPADANRRRHHRAREIQEI